MYEVWVSSFPANDLHTLERIVRKNNRKYSDKEVFAAAKKVQAGQEMMIRGFHEEDIAGRLLQEVELHGGKGEVRAAEG